MNLLLEAAKVYLVHLPGGNPEHEKQLETLQKLCESPEADIAPKDSTQSENILIWAPFEYESATELLVRIEELETTFIEVYNQGFLDGSESILK